MIHQPNWVRDRLLRLFDQMLFQFDSSVSCLPMLEADIRNALTPDKRFDLATEFTRTLMGKFGHDSGAPKDQRFDKVRRAYKKRAPKPPKGLNFRTPAERRKERAERETALTHEEPTHGATQEA